MTEGARAVARIEERVEGGDRTWRLYVFETFIDEFLDREDVDESAAWWRKKLDAYAAARVQEEREACAETCLDVFRGAPNTRESGFRQNEVSHGCIASARAIRQRATPPGGGGA